MGKRSNFPKVPRDLYVTPYRAVLPLVPYLRAERVRTFAEPCAGNGDLVRHLESFGLRCTYAGDIATGQDALATTDYGDPDIICTNTPFSRHNRPVVRRMIEHFQRIVPTWLLLPSDWATNQWAAPYLPACSDIVPIGKVRWIEGTEDDSMDNFAWYRFDARHTAGPLFHWRDRPALRHRAATCAQCGASYVPRRSDSRFCSDACRQRAHRERVAVTEP